MGVCKFSSDAFLWQEGGVGTRPVSKTSFDTSPDCGHPCPKPLEWMNWAVSLTDSQTILDPFLGSGTTLVAAKLKGLRAVGIEKEEKYCQIAVERLRQGVLLPC